MCLCVCVCARTHIVCLFLMFVLFSFLWLRLFFIETTGWVCDLYWEKQGFKHDSARSPDQSLGVAGLGFLVRLASACMEGVVLVFVKAVTTDFKLQRIAAGVIEFQFASNGAVTTARSIART